MRCARTSARVAAQDEGRFDDEIVPVTVPGKKGDDGDRRRREPAPDTDAEALAKLKPAFQPDGGTVTAGNAPGITDGAAALRHRLRGGAERRRSRWRASSATRRRTSRPKWLFEAPIHGVRRLIEKVGGSASTTSI